MLFNSYLFIFIFLPLVLLGYYGLNHLKQNKWALVFVLGMSFWFYGYNSIQYLLILIISILLNYGIVEIMDRTKGKMARKVSLWIGVLLNIGILFYYKYYDFFVENVNAIFKTDFVLLKLILPLGISFYTFQQLSYVIDSYKKECEKYSFLEYATYVSFFPQLIAGPIVYHNELIPQLRKEENHRLNYENLSKGIYAISLGMAKKVLLADTFSKFVNQGYAHIDMLNTPSALLMMICYSLQIYFDFSGYCDMAYGIGYMFNIELPINFNSPYKATTISEFWDRWHITLTRFFTKYIYIPLGGSRKGKYRTYLNMLIVFTVSGLWHGANWTFVLWGMLNGIAKVFDKVFKNLIARIPRVIRLGVTFLATTFAWSIFRAESIGQAVGLWKRVFTVRLGAIHTSLTDTFCELLEIKALCRVGLASVIGNHTSFILMLFVFAILLACFMMKNTQEKVSVMRLTNKKLLVVIGLMLWSIVSLSDVSEFLYFNF